MVAQASRYRLGVVLAAVIAAPVAFFHLYSISRAQGPEGAISIPSETTKIASIVAGILAEFMNETRSAGGAEFYNVDQKRFITFYSDLGSLVRDLERAQKTLKEEAVWPRSKLSLIDEERFKQALSCVGCAVWGKAMKSSPHPSTNRELVDLILYRLRSLSELCKYYIELGKMDRNHWANFEHHLHLLRVITITY